MLFAHIVLSHENFGHR
uniref:Uncharacterized protein n=1 Tax=Rhizophora mucronata TaxID=61149 RepID=A0A2P2QSV9_RHIMU